MQAASFAVVAAGPLASPVAASWRAARTPLLRGPQNGHAEKPRQADLAPRLLLLNKQHLG